MIVKEFVDYLFSLNYDNLDKKTIEQVKLCFIDFLGVYKRGIEEKTPRTLNKPLKNIYGGNSNLFNNAMTMAIAAHCLDLDDGHRFSQTHLGAVVFSTAISIALNYEITGREFFEAIVGGYEVGAVLGMMANPNHRNQGFHSTGTIGSFAAAAVSSKLLKLSYSETINCFGICGTSCSGLLESDHQGSMAKSLHAGLAVRNGLSSAFLAHSGFTGPESIIDGKEGFISAMAIGDLEHNLEEINIALNKGNIKDIKTAVSKINPINNKKLERLVKTIGNNHINQVYFKLYPFCRHLHSSIDSILKLRPIIKEDYESIEQIIISTYKIASQHNNLYPSNNEQLKQSLPYGVSIAIVCGEPDLNIIENLINKGLLEKDLNKIKDSQVLDIKKLADKVVILENKQFTLAYPDKSPSHINIKLNESFRGGKIENTTYYPIGENENPLDPGQIIAKFRKLNPDYIINELNLIDEIENSNLKDILNILL